MTDPDPGAETLDVQTAQAAVLTVMRLFRALERVDTRPDSPAVPHLEAGGGRR